jgi:hypothetical protein
MRMRRSRSLIPHAGSAVSVPDGPGRGRVPDGVDADGVDADGVDASLLTFIIFLLGDHHMPRESARLTSKIFGMSRSIVPIPVKTAHRLELTFSPPSRG